MASESLVISKVMVFYPVSDLFHYDSGSKCFDTVVQWTSMSVANVQVVESGFDSTTALSAGDLQN